MAADFSASTRSGNAPLVVTFTDTSTGNVQSRSWDFGDGGTSSGAIAVHTFQNAGQYRVSLTVNGPDGSDTVSRAGYITVDNAPLQADFTASPTSGAAPLSVSFLDTTAGPASSWSWDFGDGQTGQNQNPTHTYRTPGTYTVRLTSTGSGSSDTEQKSGLIRVSGDESGGPVAAYSFDAGNGGTLGDASGNGNDGAISGAQWSGQGRHGGALYFDGNGDMVSVPDSPSLDASGELTLEAWVYPTATLSGWQTVMLKERDSGLAYALNAHSDRNAPATAVRIGGDRNTFGTSRLETGRWSHLAATYDGYEHRLYVNGELVASQQLTGSIAQSGGALRLGGNTVWGNYFRGRMDDVRVYDRALSAGEIREDMDRAVSGGSSSGGGSSGSTPSGTGNTTLRINAGGDSYTDANGHLWEPDRGYNTGQSGGSSTWIRRTGDDYLYQSNRWDDGSNPELRYQLPVANGSYLLRLHFAEVWSGAYYPGARVFDVRVEGQLELHDLDVFRETGGSRTALVKEIPVQIGDGSLTVDFTHVSQDPMVSAIELLPR
jgi:PKD repeat protein